MINAGKYNKKIQIFTRIISRESGYQMITVGVLRATLYASIKTTRGMTLIANGSGFEKAYTSFVIRTPKIMITRDNLVRYNFKTYTIEYINNINEDGVEIELQCKEITH